MERPLDQPIACLELLWVRRDGREVVVRGLVGEPKRLEGPAWTCPIALEGVEAEAAIAHGEGPVHALCLGIALLHARLVDLLDQGELLVHLETRRPLDRAWLDALFVKL